jgi:high affinity sulfate transporter 1
VKRITSWIPLLGDLSSYQPQWLSRDVIAGLSVAAVQVPTAIAYANMAGFPPQVGLYASMLPVLIYALFGSSRQLIVGPDAATCALVAAALLPLAQNDVTQYIKLSAALSIMAGALMVVGGIAGLGFIVNFFARPILIGFLTGIAISIITGQLGKFVGMTIASRDFVPSLVELLRRLNEVHGHSLAVGLGTLALLIVMKRLIPRAPLSLIALLAAGIGVFFLGWAQDGIKLVGAVPSGLPKLAVPGVGYSAVQNIFMDAAGLVIVSFTSGMLTARSFATRNRYEIDADREMRAMGLANIASGLTGGFAISGADSRTAVNDASGGKTRLVSVVAALATAAVVLFLSEPLSQLPLAALAGVLIFSAWGLIDITGLRRLWKIDRFEFFLSILTMLGVLSIGVLPGVVFAIVLALLHVLVKIYHPAETILGILPDMPGYNDVSRSDKATQIPGVIICRFEAPLLFFNADRFKNRLLSLVDKANPRPRWFVLSAEAITQLDTTGAAALDEFCAELKSRNVQLVLARPKLYMHRYGQPLNLGKKIGAENVFLTIESAVESIQLRESNPLKAENKAFKRDLL